MGEGEPLRFDLGDDYKETLSFHPWFAVRGAGAARAAVAFTTSPDWLRDQEKLTLVADGDDAALAAALACREAGNAVSGGGNKAESLLDLCAGVGTIGAMAARLGFDALSLELSDIPHLISQVLYDFSVSMAAADEREIAGSWRGYVTEVGDFADAVWRGAKERLKELFDEDVDIRVWVRFMECPFCGTHVPLVSNTRLSDDAALNIIPDPSTTGGGRYPRFRLLRTEFPDLRGTFAKGHCTCPTCRNRFHFRGQDLISLRSVPVAIRMRNSAVLSEVDSPDVYVQQVEMASYDWLAASSRRLDGRVVLAAGQPIFHDIKGEPIRVRDAFLPRQRAYFAALAESMSAESALLARRTVLTEAQRTAVRVAVALLISGQADFVNTCVHSSIDKHPSAPTGPLRVGGLFTEVGGFWLERFWRNRLNHVLGLLRVNSSAARPIRAIKANADAIPLGDAAVSAVIWDPPYYDNYYDNIDYDTVAEHYQSILAAVVPDIIGAPLFQPRLPRPERKRRYEDDLVKQAREARRVVSPNGSIGVFWPARDPADLDRFLELIGPAALQFVRAVRLDTIRPPRAALTYLLVLQPVPEAASEVPVDTERVLSLAADGAPALYDGLADLFESVLEPDDLDELLADEHSGSARQRLARFLASQPELEQVLVDLGRPSLLRELVSRGARRDDLRRIDTRGLAQRLLGQLGFAVARPVRFSIREALRDCDNTARRLELADSDAAVREAFLAGFNRIEGILRYTVFAWAYLECGDEWKALFEEVVSSAMNTPYPGPDRLSFGHLHALFTKLPATFSANDQEPEQELFTNVARALKKAKVNEKLSNLVYWRNGVGHQKEFVTALSVPQLRHECLKALSEARAALAEIDHQRLLPVTVRPEEERRYRYNRRVLRLLDPDDAAIEVNVGSETDLTEPLVYFAPDKKRPRDTNPKFLRAAVVEALSGLAGRDSESSRGLQLPRPYVWLEGGIHADQYRGCCRWGAGKRDRRCRTKDQHGGRRAARPPRRG